jgi:ABC-type antimicrobial peptide transport system permease subunit
MAEPAVSALKNVDPELPAFSVVSMEDIVSDARAEERTLAVLFAAFGLLTLVLLALGIYAVVSLAVAGRAREIGIRLILGGPRVGVLQLLLREGLRPGVQGAVMGLAAALVLTRLLDSIFVRVNPLDPWIYTGSAGLSLTVVALASLVPALDALRGDPTESVRAD